MDFSGESNFPIVKQQPIQLRIALQISSYYIVLLRVSSESKFKVIENDNLQLSRHPF